MNYVFNSLLTIELSLSSLAREVHETFSGPRVLEGRAYVSP